MHGFTLLELLIAVAIFAVIGLAAHRMLRDVLQARDHAEQRGVAFDRLQRAIELLERDVAQVVVRPVRDVLGDPLPALRGTDVGGIEFTRGGRANPLDLPRPGLERVAWLVRDGDLLRQSWAVLDQAEDTLPRERIALTGVRALAIEFIDEEGNRQPYWPPERDQPVPLPVALVFRLDVEPWGEIVRWFAMPGVLDLVPALPGGSDPPEDDVPDGDAGSDSADPPPPDAVDPDIPEGDPT